MCDGNKATTIRLTKIQTAKLTGNQQTANSQKEDRQVLFSRNVKFPVKVRNAATIKIKRTCVIFIKNIIALKKLKR